VKYAKNSNTFLRKRAPTINAPWFLIGYMYPVFQEIS
jgi:hypothetical protein